MNSGVLFQMLGMSNTGNKTANTQTSNSKDYKSNSFEKEMDKAFEKSEKAEVPNRKDVAKPSDVKDKTQNSKPTDQDPVDEQEPVREESDKDIVSEAQALEAAAAQLAVLNRTDGVDLEKVLGEATLLVAKAGDEKSLEGENASIFDKLSKAEITDEGVIKLPESQSDEAMSEKMLKMLKEGELKSTDLQKGGGITAESEITEVQSEMGKEPKQATQDDLLLQDADALTEGEPVVQDNLTAKNNLFDASKVNVKVAEAPVDTSRSDAANQLADKIMYKLNQGKQEFELELNPRNLGKIHIKMIFENGNAELVMSTSNSKAHQLLSSQAEAIKAILQGNTGMESNITVKQSDGSENQFDRDNFQEQSQNNQQNSKKQQEESKKYDSITFADKLRLGLINDMAEAM